MLRNIYIYIYIIWYFLYKILFKMLHLFSTNNLNPRIRKLFGEVLRNNISQNRTWVWRNFRTILLETSHNWIQNTVVLARGRGLEREVSRNRSIIQCILNWTAALNKHRRTRENSVRRDILFYWPLLGRFVSHGCCKQSLILLWSETMNRLPGQWGRQC
jgi:hypothetical protein